MEYWTISGASGGDAIGATYGASALPTTCLIAPDHNIVEQDIWPISTVGDITSILNGYGLAETPCTDPLIADFSGAPLVIPVGSTVDFTDLSTGGATSWNWDFPGGSPATSTLQNPTITYNTAGTYDVTLEVSNASLTDTETKTAYIEVQPPIGPPPVADFVGTPTLIPVGSSVDFTDLSTNSPTIWKWTFEGADVTTSNLQNPSDIVYSTAGLYEVKLKVTNTGGSDSLTKVDYIEVYPDTSSIAPKVHFTGAPRLITAGETVDFTDESDFFPVSWSWNFEGGTPTTSNDQNPTGISYSTPGLYNVTLTASNGSGSGSLTKVDYIVVSDYPMDQLCDTITNMLPGENMTFQQLSSTWGYLPGHNGKLVTAYAERFEDWTVSEISSFIFPVAKSYSAGGKVKFIIWNGDLEPDSMLGSKQVNVSTLTSGLFNVVHFDSNIEVDGIFFAGFEISYAAGDTFAIYMAPDRGPSGDNTLYCRKSGTWYTATDLFNIHTSSGLTPVGCLVGIQTFEFENSNVIIFPNPSDGQFNIDLSSVDLNNFSLQVYDISGRMVTDKYNVRTEGLYTVDLGGSNEGVYILKMRINNIPVTRMVSLVK
ncbi:MAG: hypothetical protein A2W91_09275 [Bacteroidetes bacterium GWF2_38_335]|nr:MAG: hypothetical protein A2W91_09275 [Bacteroidetes bacterium GWF2_38_335]OFY80839.1 MAG: hypothetical protein A2281_09225 [Bacteroidetes bacterium RIFOXYA12_FULL_38_20]HBS86242.1 hypothetical protein [Bacteroidales bacterium]